jgi:hypothetical protein
MPILCVTLPRLGPRRRIVIVIVIYLAAFRLAPGDSVALALGGALGGLLAIESATAARATRIQEQTR